MYFFRSVFSTLSVYFLGISISRSLCTAVVLVGIFITIEPQIWGLDEDSTASESTHKSTASRILWPLCFLMGFLPVGLMNVFCEKELQKEEVVYFILLNWRAFIFISFVNRTTSKIKTCTKQTLGKLRTCTN